MMEVLDEALKHFSSEQLLRIEERLTEVLQLIKNRKIQKLMEEQNLELQTELAYIQGLNQSPLTASIKEIFSMQDSVTTLPPVSDPMEEANPRDSHAKDPTSDNTMANPQDPTSDGSSESEASSRNSHT